MNPPAAAGKSRNELAGVAGWLLALCLFLTLIGPAISAWLLVERHAAVAPQVSDSAAFYAVLLASMLLTVAATIYGVVAGLCLWRVRPGAVATARRALWAGLAADIVGAAFDVATQPMLAAGSPFLRHLLWQVVPDLVAFTACLGYLQHSRRVFVTYPAEH